jgi:ATPase subunit of ABC transporter with duplicated ATPase domains
MLLQISGLTKTTPLKDLFEKVNFAIAKGDRLALVGENGSGKTTLLKIILGFEESDSGQILRSNGLKINYQPQDPDDFFVIEKTEELLLSSARQEKEYSAVITGLGLWDVLSRNIKHFSGGERTKIAIAHALIVPADLIILDEPTNYLDTKSLKWLENYIVRRDLSLLVVSHDRAFLDKTVNGVLLLETGKVKMYRGNYSDYFETTKKERDGQFSTFHLQEQKKDRLLAQVDTVKGQALKTELSTTDDFERGKAKKVAKKAKVMERRLEKMMASDEWVEKPYDLPKIHLEMNTTLTAGQTVVRAKDVSFGFLGKEKLFSNVNFRLESGGKIAVLGENGSGKTTFVRLLVGELLPDSGEIWKNAKAKFGFFSQRLLDIPEEAIVLDAARGDSSMPEHEIRNILGALLLGGDKVFEKVSSLSLGEKTRLGLAKLLISAPDVLILDEFTAHLDFDSLMKIEEAINAFAGAIILVTHDRHMLKELRLDRKYLLQDGCVKEIFDNYLEN